MQSWEAMQPAANYDQHNNWYNSMFAAQIKTEPDTTPSPPLTVSSATSQLEQYLNMKHQERQQQTVLDSLTTTNIMSPSSNSANGNNETMQHYYESNLQQHPNSQQQQHQQYQQQFQAAQQAAAQSQTTQMPLGFNPLTPPGLPNAVLPSMPHFYSNHSNIRQNPQTLTPVSPTVQPHLGQTPCDSTEKIQSALTPRSTPPMDITPPKSPKSLSTQPSEQEKDQDAMSNSSEDLKYMVESEDDESIRMPIYNSHGKMKNYKCKSCGLVAITKVAFWEHARSHMKPDKILQCPKCPFVTELKHHLEYHIRKHKNLKPFQCDKCSYSCVNKSMLNSHRKSHSSVYQYRCADCDYATKYCHSFKLHLRKYDHKPGLVLDEEGMPNPSIIIDVYGTRRGPKSKSGGSGNTLKRHASSGSSSERQSNVAKIPALPNNSSTSQLSAALQGFPPSQHQMSTSPAKSTSSSTSERTAQYQQHQQQQQQDQKKQQQQPQQKQSHQQQPTPPPMQNILNPLATIMQQNRNMAFFPYWNLNLQMLAAQQQAAVLAQLSPGMRDTAIQHLQLHHSDAEDRHSDGGENDEDDHKSVDSAMDLSQGTPTKEEEEEEQPEQQSVQTPGVVMNLKLSEEIGGNNETPLISSVASSRRKGRVLKLETSSVGVLASPDVQTNDVHSSSADELMDTGVVAPSATSTPPTTNTSASSTASSSGNNSTSSKTTSTNTSPETTNGTTATTKNTSSNLVGAIYECKYCDIFFKDAVLYTIHMGYHSCDDVFKCNMCGEKCDGPVGLFVHMARNAHS